MSKLFKALKRGTKAVTKAMGPGEYEAGGKRISCPHCNSTEFAEGRAQLNTAGMSFLNLDWANKSITTLTCTKCGCLQWYANPPQKVV